MRIDLSTREGMDAMLALHDAGETYAQIAPRCHVAGRPINSKTLADRCHKYRRNGVVPRVRLDITRVDMLEYVARGLTPQAVAVELGIHCSTVMLMEKRVGVFLPRAKKRAVKPPEPCLTKSDLPSMFFLPAELRPILTSRWA